MTQLNQSNFPGRGEAKYPFPLRLLRGFFGILNRLSPEAAMRLAFRLFTRPRRRPSSADVTELRQSALTFWVNVNKKNLAVHTWGKGPAVLFVHGWEGHAFQVRNLVESLVRRGYRVVTFDGPAHGDSEGRETHLPEFIAALRHIAELVEPVHGIIAHSFGGVATLNAIRHGLSVERLVLVGVPASVRYLLGNYAQLLNLSPEVLQRLIQFLERQFQSTVDEVAPINVAPQVPFPTMLLHDSDDQIVHPQNARQLAAALPNATLVFTAGLGHNQILYAPEAVACMASFLHGEAEAERSGCREAQSKAIA